MSKYKTIIAIDPDATQSGVAEVKTETGEIAVYKLGMAELLRYLKIKATDYNIIDRETKVIIEAGWLNESNWHILSRYMTARKAAAIGRSVGMNHQTGMIIEQICKDYFGLPTELQRPLKKCWKGKDGKITQQEMQQLTEHPKLPRMNQDQRDALLIAWVHTGLPMRMKVPPRTK